MFLLLVAILVIYLTQMLKMDDDSATAIYHAFNMLCYFSPLFGAMLADSLLGKYKLVTFSLSNFFIVYLSSYR